MKSKELPLHIQYAIQHEKMLIELRLRQIEGYKKKIKIMEDGGSYDDALREIKPVFADIKFVWSKYNKLKKSKDVNSSSEKDM